MPDTIQASADAPAKQKGKKHQKGTLVFTTLALFILLALLANNFFTGNNLYNLLRQTSINGIVAIGMTFVIISAGIDLSVGAVVGFSGIVAALLMAEGGWGIFPACAVALIGSAAVGFINGALVFHGKVPPFIATLGTMTMLRGTIMLVSGARNIAGLPKPFRDFAQTTIFGFLPMLFVVWLLIILLAIFITKMTVFGRKVYAVGSNVEATRLSGVDLKWVYYGIYVTCSLFCGIAGLLFSSRLASGVPTGGQGYEMDAIAAAVIGGASLSGAEGSIIGTVLGAFIMAMLRNGGNLLKIDPFVLEIVIGALIVVAVLIDQKRKTKG